MKGPFSFGKRALGYYILPPLACSPALFVVLSYVWLLLKAGSCPPGAPRGAQASFSVVMCSLLIFEWSQYDYKTVTLPNAHV